MGYSVIEPDHIADDLCKQADGSWYSGAAAAAWDQLQAATNTDPIMALAIVAVVVQCVSPDAVARIAATVLWKVTESNDEDIAARVAEYRQHDVRMREAIDAICRYREKARVLQEVLQGGDFRTCSTWSASGLPLPNPYPYDERLGDVFLDQPAVDLGGDADDLFDAFDVLVSNDPQAAWRCTLDVVGRAVSERDRLIVAQSVSRLLNLNERLVTNGLVERLRSSPPFRAVLRYCRFRVGEALLDEMLRAAIDG